MLAADGSPPSPVHSSGAAAASSTSLTTSLASSSVSSSSARSLASHTPSLPLDSPPKDEAILSSSPPSSTPSATPPHRHKHRRPFSSILGLHHHHHHESEKEKEKDKDKLLKRFSVLPRKFSKEDKRVGEVKEGVEPLGAKVTIKEEPEEIVEEKSTQEKEEKGSQKLDKARERELKAARKLEEEARERELKAARKLEEERLRKEEKEEKKRKKQEKQEKKKEKKKDKEVHVGADAENADGRRASVRLPGVDANLLASLAAKMEEEVVAKRKSSGWQPELEWEVGWKPSALDPHDEVVVDEGSAQTVRWEEDDARVLHGDSGARLAVAAENSGGGQSLEDEFNRTSEETIVRAGGEGSPTYPNGSIVGWVDAEVRVLEEPVSYNYHPPSVHSRSDSDDHDSLAAIRRRFSRSSFYTIRSRRTSYTYVEEEEEEENESPPFDLTETFEGDGSQGPDLDLGLWDTRIPMDTTVVTVAVNTNGPTASLSEKTEVKYYPFGLDLSKQQDASKQEVAPRPSTDGTSLRTPSLRSSARMSVSSLVPTIASDATSRPVAATQPAAAVSKLDQLMAICGEVVDDDDDEEGGEGLPDGAVGADDAVDGKDGRPPLSQPKKDVPSDATTAPPPSQPSSSSVRRSMWAEKKPVVQDPSAPPIPRPPSPKPKKVGPEVFEGLVSRLEAVMAAHRANGGVQAIR
ncbi:hypothetical protein HK104_004888 [Borealophlyctis nickersoniae]|nr:hypothetical protein HK104_004888 [Borealophlyctis nickersoniae]